MDGKAIPNRTLVGLIGDMAELVARAFFGGLAAAVAMGAAILALSASAQASTQTAAYTPLGDFVTASASGNKTWSAAPTPVVDHTSAGVGALWAKGTSEGFEASSSSDESADALQLLLGLVALLSAAMVAVAAYVPTRVAASPRALRSPAGRS